MLFYSLRRFFLSNYECTRRMLHIFSCKLLNFFFFLEIRDQESGYVSLTFIFLPFFAEFDNDDRYAVAHNINDYDEDENDEDDDEFTTKDYSKKQNERNYYSSTNRNNQRPASNKNHHQKSNSVSEKSTSLWSNSGKFFQKRFQMHSVENF